MRKSNLTYVAIAVIFFNCKSATNTNSVASEVTYPYIDTMEYAISYREMAEMLNYHTRDTISKNIGDSIIHTEVYIKRFSKDSSVFLGSKPFVVDGKQVFLPAQAGILLQ